MDLLLNVLTYDFSGNAIDVPEESRSVIFISRTFSVMNSAKSFASIAAF
jgi:hypothetical protein